MFALRLPKCLTSSKNLQKRSSAYAKLIFFVVDIVAILTDQLEYQKARKYWNKLNQRLREEGSEVVTDCHRLKLPAKDGKLRETDCANVKSLLRVIQSIPSKNAEPFKQWLAQVGYDRVQEIENPELAQKRMKELFRQKGYSDEWIEKRVRGIAVRDELTDEWKKRGLITDRVCYSNCRNLKRHFWNDPQRISKIKRIEKGELERSHERSGTHLHDVGRSIYNPNCKE